MDYEAKHDKKKIAEEEKPYKEKFKEIRKGIEDMADSCEFYKERIKFLEREVSRLADELGKAQGEVAYMTHMYEHGAEMLQLSRSRRDEMLEEKNKEIAMAKEAIYLAAMREVSLR